MRLRACRELERAFRAVTRWRAAARAAAAAAAARRRQAPAGTSSNGIGGAADGGSRSCREAVVASVVAAAAAATSAAVAAAVAGKVGWGKDAEEEDEKEEEEEEEEGDAWEDRCPVALLAVQHIDKSIEVRGRKCVGFGLCRVWAVPSGGLGAGWGVMAGVAQGDQDGLWGAMGRTP